MKLLFVACLLVASPVLAQQCQTEMVPALAPWTAGTPSTSGSAQIWFATPPTVFPREASGLVTYPIQYIYPANATRVSLITLMATTFKFRGWQLLNLGHAVDAYGVPITAGKQYVSLVNNTVAEWVPGGITFIWYHAPDDRVINGVQSDGITPQAAYYDTIIADDVNGLTGENLSVPLLAHESVSLGVRVDWRYPAPVRVDTQLHLQVCR